VSIVERPNYHPSNLSFAERSISVVLGLGLAAVAARPRPNPVLSAIALAAGAYLAWRGATGRDPIKTAFIGQDGA
jgi:uncharacterized membrane protein